MSRDRQDGNNRVKGVVHRQNIQKKTHTHRTSNKHQYKHHPTDGHHQHQ